jgi:AAA family ATP:ADP antiporter
MSKASDSSERRSLLARTFSTLTAVERREMPTVVTAFFLFFCVLGGYFAVRPVRETMGTIIGRDRVANLWLATWIVSLAIVPIYGAVVAKIRRSVFLPLIYGFVAVALAIVGGVLQANQRSVAVAQFFYVFISVLSLFLVSVFWRFLVELFDSGQAKRLFPVIAAGGTAGALVGPLFTDFAARVIGNAGILFVGAALFALAVALQAILIRLWKRGPEPRRESGEAREHTRDRALGGNLFAGITLVLKSPYLLAIAGYVALLATANTFLYFEQLRLVQVTFADTQTRTSVFARIDWIVQSLTILAQLFITGRVASRLGVVVLLIIIPVAIFFGFVALAIWNTFAVLAVVIVLRRSGEYAFVRPGREMLWSPMTKETKYKAKNFVDVPVYRGADAAVAQLQRAIEAAGFGVQTVALFGAIGATLWAVNGWWLGRRHDSGVEEEKALARAAAR